MSQSALYFGKITRIATTGYWFTIAQHWPGVEFGPVPRLNPYAPLPKVTDTTSAHTHTITLAPMAPGDTVLVAQVATDDFVILGPLAGGVT